LQAVQALTKLKDKNLLPILIKMCNEAMAIQDPDYSELKYGICYYCLLSLYELMK